MTGNKTSGHLLLVYDREKAYICVFRSVCREMCLI